jgi:hypothetical protein
MIFTLSAEASMGHEHALLTGTIRPRAGRDGPCASAGPCRARVVTGLWTEEALEVVKVFPDHLQGAVRRGGERPGALRVGEHVDGVLGELGSARTTSARAMTQRPRRTKGGTAHLLRRSLIAVRESPGGTDSAELAMARLRTLLLPSPG